MDSITTARTAAPPPDMRGAGKNIADAFAALEARGTETEAEQLTPAQIKAGKKTTAPAKPPERKAENETAKRVSEDEDDAGNPEKDRTGDAKAGNEGVSGDNKSQQQAGKPKRPSDFMREEIAKLKTERDAYKSEIEKVKQQKPTELPEVKSLSEKLTATEKRAKEYEDLLRTTAYERSREFKEKFDQPFLDSYAAGIAKVKALRVVDESGQGRPGTAEDWQSITAAGSEEEAAQRIEQLFGTGVRAQMVTQHYMETVNKFRSKQQALTDAEKTATERHTQFTELQTKLAGEVKSLWETQTKLDAVPDQWKPYIAPKGNDKDGKPIDPEWDAALSKGYERYDRAMSEDARAPHLTSEQRKEIISRAAAVRNQAAAFRPLVQHVRKMTTRITELEAELDAYRKSEPGAGDGDTAQADAGQPSDRMAGALANLEKLGKPGVFY
jgi:uncharacterized coiled-coil DUF342 family protein